VCYKPCASVLTHTYLCRLPLSSPIAAAPPGTLPTLATPRLLDQPCHRGDRHTFPPPLACVTSPGNSEPRAQAILSQHAPVLDQFSLDWHGPHLPMIVSGFTNM
jgi:hypothetical protein